MKLSALKTILVSSVILFSACSDATEGSTEQPIGMGSDFVVQTSLSQESVAAGTAVQAVCAGLLQTPLQVREPEQSLSVLPPQSLSV